jgi:hypothetical protein
MHELSRQVTVNATEQFSPLVPAKAGIQNLLLAWIAACAGTSGRYFTSAYDAPLLRVSASKSS